MTKLLTIVAVLALTACSKQDDKPTPDPAAERHQVEVATLVTKKLAFEGYPMWAMQHPEKECPDKLDDVLVGLTGSNLDGGKDPWGHPYVSYCGPTLPPGARGFAVMSLGPDGKEGTADDIKSW